MNILDFYEYGPDADSLYAHNIDNLQPPVVSLLKDVSLNFFHQAYKATQPLYARIQNAALAMFNDKTGFNTDTPEAGNYILDDVLHVHTLPYENRVVEKNFWAHYRDITLATGSVGIVGALVTLSALASATSVWARVALGVMEVAFSALALVSGYRGLQAHGQLKQWENGPLPLIAALRTRAYGEDGFFFALDQDLKGNYETASCYKDTAQVLHPSEVFYLYGQSFEKQQQSFDTAALLPAEAKVEVLQRFLDKSVLEKKAIDYACPPTGTLRELLLEMNRQYEGLKERMKLVNTHFAQKRNEVQKAFATQIKVLEAERAALMAPFQNLTILKKDAIDQEYRNIAHEGRELSVLEIETWKERCRKEDLLFKTALTPIQISFNAALQTLTTWNETELQKIEECRATYLLPCYERASNLFNRAHATYTSGVLPPSAPEKEVVSLEPIVVSPAPSAPLHPDWERLQLPQVPGGPTPLELEDYVHKVQKT